MNHFLLDSGAFSCWSNGAVVNLDEYIDFCDEHRWVTAFVNLDVIPGKPNDSRSLTPSGVEESCQQGWKNYLRMLERLPFEMVMPVFHQGDDIKWLKKFIDFGCSYIGISPANDRTTEQRMKWIDTLRSLLLDEEGKLRVKTHGFAVTSFRLMKFIPWHSVDSASWVRQSAYGSIYIPYLRGGEWCYDQSPFLLSVSPKSPSRDERQAHITTLSPTVKSMVDKYLSETLKMSVGEFEISSVGSGYKLGENELWWEKGKKDKVMRKLTKGLMTSHQQRFWANMKFLQRANKALSEKGHVNHIYFAGADGSLIPQVEFNLKRRLMSFHTIKSTKAAQEVFEGYKSRALTT